MSDIILRGFDGSSFVCTIKMQLAEKGFAQFEQMQLNVLEGKPRRAEPLERHPFGKVPVLDHDAIRILETSAIFHDESRLAGGAEGEARKGGCASGAPH